MHSFQSIHKRPPANQRGFLAVAPAEHIQDRPSSAGSRSRFAFVVAGLVAAGLAALALAPHGSDDAADRAQLARQAAAGSPRAELLLGLAYRDGRYGLARDARAAARWLGRAARSGNVYASAALGDAYANGAGVSRDETAAEHWWHEAAEAGNAHAASQLGLAMNSRAVSDAEHDQARRWLARGAALGDAGARRALGIDVASSPKGFSGGSRDDAGMPTLSGIATGIYGLLQAADPQLQSIDSLKQRAFNGDSVAQYQLAMRYRDGSWGVEADPQLALRWLEQAAKDGNAVAMTTLAEAYRGGTMGLRQNEALAAKWQQRAVQARAAATTVALR
jgi:TPR repeat protein